MRPQIEFGTKFLGSLYFSRDADGARVTLYAGIFSLAASLFWFSDTFLKILEVGPIRELRWAASLGASLFFALILINKTREIIDVSSKTAVTASFLHDGIWNVEKLSNLREEYEAIKSAYKELEDAQRFYEALVWKMGQVMIPASLSILAFALTQEGAARPLGAFVGFLLYALFLGFYYRFRILIRHLRRAITYLLDSSSSPYHFSGARLIYKKDSLEKSSIPLRLFPYVLAFSFFYLSTVVTLTVLFLNDVLGLS